MNADGPAASVNRGPERIGICLAADAKFELGVRIALFSALEQLSVAADVFILDGGLTEPAALLAAVSAHPRCAQCRVIAPELGTLTARLAGTRWDSAQLFGGRFGIAAWLRVLLPELLPARNRVIYLDADTLVRTDLVELWEAADPSRPIWAVRDFYLPVFALGFPWADDEPWFEAARPYFNSGVLVLNLDLLRRREFFQRVAEHLGTIDQVGFADQDVINAVVADEIGDLDPRWNVQQVEIARPDLFFGAPAAGRPRSDRAMRRDARIVHFTGFKPWQPEGIRPNRWSITHHLEYLWLVRRFGGYTDLALARRALGWLVGLSARASRAVRNRLQAIQW